MAEKGKADQEQKTGRLCYLMKALQATGWV